eukprot:1258154-Pyramimonas_sp.AAC.1
METAYKDLEAKFGGVFRNPRYPDPRDPEAEHSWRGAGEGGVLPAEDEVMHVDVSELGEVVGSVTGLSDERKRELLDAFRSQAKKARHRSSGPRPEVQPGTLCDSRPSALSSSGRGLVEGDGATSASSSSGAASLSAASTVAVTGPSQTSACGVTRTSTGTSTFSSAARAQTFTRAPEAAPGPSLLGGKMAKSAFKFVTFSGASVQAREEGEGQASRKKRGLGFRDLLSRTRMPLLAVASIQREGWRVSTSDCISTDSGNPSGGTMIATRRHLDCWNTPGTSSCLFPGRVSRCFLRCGSFGLISCYSVYLEDSIGLVGVNRKVLKAIVSDIVGHRWPCIVGGDFNV